MSDNKKLQELLKNLQTDEHLRARYISFHKANNKKAWKTFCHKANIPFYKRIGAKRLLQYAAALLIPLSVITAGLLHWDYTQYSRQSLEAITSLPQYGATLTLANGETIQLSLPDSVSSQKVDHAIVGREKIVYNHSDSEGEQQFNTLSTDAECEFRIELSDGTLVHLNKSSKLIYPVNFGSTDRTVSLEGEAYFEIAKDARRPFFVQTGSVKVKQYGTSFNLSAYAGCNAQVVLVEGSVEVSAEGHTYMMQPGQLVDYNPSDQKLDVRQVNTDLYTAWHTGKLSFQDMPLSDLVGVLSQWYEVEIRYEDESLKHIQFSGRITRQDNLNNILERLEYTQDMTFQIDGRSILISRKKKIE